MKGWFSLEQNDIDTIKELPNFSEGIIDLENLIYLREQKYDHCIHSIVNF